MHSIQPLLPLLRDLDGATLSAQTFSEACVASGWPQPVYDGIGLWEVEHPDAGISLVLDTETKPTTLICRLEQDDEYDAGATAVASQAAPVGNHIEVVGAFNV